MECRAYSIFTAGYWASAVSEFHKLRSLVFAGLMVALGVVLGFFSIPAGLNLRISPAFFVPALGSLVFGPVVGLTAGLAYDLIGFLVAPAGPFFPGYTLSSMLEFFIYGLFLYRSRLSVWRIFLAKSLVNYGVHVFLGSFWSEIMFQKGYYYFFLKSMVKNTIMLPFEVVLITALFQVFLPVLVREGILPKQKRRFIPFF